MGQKVRERGRYHMSRRSQKEKAETLRALHRGGDILVLPNIWDSARRADPRGEGVSGGRDRQRGGVDVAGVSGRGEDQPLDADRSPRADRGSVDVPVTADIETGYGESPDELEVTIQQVIESGVVGVNIEDSLGKGGGLREVEEQCRRIACVRDLADRRGVPLVIAETGWI